MPSLKFKSWTNFIELFLLYPLGYCVLFFGHPQKLDIFLIYFSVKVLLQIGSIFYPTKLWLLCTKLCIPSSTLNIDLIVWHTQWIVTAGLFLLLFNSGLESRMLYCFRFYLMYKLICQKPAHFYLPKWLWWASFFKCL